MWCLIGVEPEIIQCAPANRIRVLVLCKGFRRPANGIGCLSDAPRRAAVTLVHKCPIVRPAGFLWWRMKGDVAQAHSGSYWHAKRLNSSIEVLVIQGILIVPDALRRIGHFVTYEPNTVVSWVGLDLIYCGAGTSPSHDSRLHARGRAVS